MFKTSLKTIALTTALSTLISTTTLSAGPISFASGWSVQKLSFFYNNTFSFGKALSMQSDDSVSIAWTRVPKIEWGATSAAWTWDVSQSVPATQLKTKGGDDRNLAFYFVFAPKAEAEALQNANIRELLGNPNVRVIIYTWGGAYERGAIFPSPYLKNQGVTIALRQASTGTFKEKVNLTKDYKRAFGGAPEALIGLAISGDSDDTDTTIDASVSKLTLK